MIDNFKKEAYSIPTFNFGGSTRPDANTLASTGDPIYVVSGCTGIYVTVNGTRYGSSALFQETFCTTVSSSEGGIVSSYNDWTQVLGFQLMDKYGMNMTTQLVEVSVYGVSTAGGSTAQVAYTSSGCKGTKMVAFALQGKDVTYHNVSGNGYITTRPLASGTTPVSPTSNNSFKMTAGMASDERVRDYILFDSDTGGAVAQIKVYEG
jgi:hypothetical protein